MLYYYLCFIDVADLHNCRLELCGWYDFNFIVGFDLHVLFSFHTFSYLLQVHITFCVASLYKQV
jgi:hypothetical protein